MRSCEKRLAALEAAHDDTCRALCLSYMVKDSDVIGRPVIWYERVTYTEDELRRRFPRVPLDMIKVYNGAGGAFDPDAL